MKIVALGVQVVYNTTEEQRAEMAKQEGITRRKKLTAVVVGNKNEKLDDDSLSLKVELDGPGQLYVKGVVFGNEEGQYCFDSTEPAEE